MKAAIYEKVGPARDVLKLVNLDDPHPGPGEVRVHLEYSGVNPTDWKSRSGAGGPLRFEYQIPGQDGAGVIDAVGAGVGNERIGERVWTYHSAWRRQNGTTANFTTVPSRQAVALPPDISSEQGAGLGIPFITAYGTLFSRGPIDGKTVLIAGGAGAVGNAAIQIARRAGAYVVTTISNEEKAKIALTAGADHVINYRQPDAESQIKAVAPDGIDHVVELNLNANLDIDLAVLKPGGTITTYSAEKEAPHIPVGKMMGSHTGLDFFLVYTLPEPQIDVAVAFITDALANGALSALPSITFPLDKVVDAHEAVENNAVGKVLVNMR